MEVIFTVENMESKLLEEIKLTVLRQQKSLPNDRIGLSDVGVGISLHHLNKG
jgi:hypothetical protein